MISKVSIRNFKCLRDVQIELERFTVFVGPNASGKSSILQGLDLLCRSFRDPQEGTVDVELSKAVSRGSKDNVELAAESGGKGYRYRIPSPSSPGIPPFCGRGVVRARDAELLPISTRLIGSIGVPTQRSVTFAAFGVAPTGSLQAHCPRPNPASPDPTVMAPDGTGIHSALANMALNDPDSWQQLQADLRRIIPTIRRLRHTKTAINQPAALLFDTVGADSLPAQQVSEGTLLVLGLLAALHASGRPSLVLLDDLDRGLHPRAQKELISLLRGLLETNPDLQIVAATHSPYMLDCMETNEVRMTVLRDDGATVCAALASHPKFEKWKDEMAPGEMWSLFGEKWLVEQGATA